MAYRSSKSLRDLLVRAKLKPDMRDDEPLEETRPCGKARCKTCKTITLTQIAKSASAATINHQIYFITCTKCGKKYVGETGDHVNPRMNSHRDDWKHKRFERSPVAGTSVLRQVNGSYRMCLSDHTCQDFLVCHRTNFHFQDGYRQFQDGRQNE